MLTNLKTCLNCSKRILGRSDKKFCDDSCRNQFNNARNQEDNVIVKNVNKQLSKNRKILIQLLGEEEMAKVSMDKLRLLQFNQKFLTHLYTTQKGVTYFFVYEYGFLPIDHDKVLLVKRNPFE